MAQEINLTVRSVEVVTVERTGNGIARSANDMRKIVANDSANPLDVLSSAELIVTPAQAVGMNAEVGSALNLQAGLGTFEIYAVVPDTITEDAATTVMISGQNFDLSGMEIIVFDDLGAEVDNFAATGNANYLTASITIADAVVGSIGVRTAGAVDSNDLTFTVEAAA